MKNKLLLSRFLYSSLAIILCTCKVFAQLESGSVFLQGNYVEVGISECGVHGTAVTPPLGPIGEYHGIQINGLGFIADHEKDGWDVATGAGQPVFCGDYFTPGSPEEGFAIQLGSSVYENHYVGCSGYGDALGGTANISGSIISYTDSAGIRQAIWEGTIDDTVLNITVQQITTLQDTALFFTTQIIITNNGTEDIADLFYLYNVDPDQDVDNCGTYMTTNTIISNPPVSDTALVTAVGEVCGCYFALTTVDPRARASSGYFSLAPNTPENAWNGDGDYELEGSYSCDCAVQMSFKTDIAAGESTTINYARLFSGDELAEALTALEISTPYELEADGEDITADDVVQVCNGESVTFNITSSADYIWTWEPATYLDASTGTSITSTPAESITYTLTGDNGADIISDIITLEVIPVMELIISASPSNIGESTGTASVAVMSGGLEPFTYVWSTGETTSSIENIPAGTYSVTITDAAGCTVTSSVTVDEVTSVEQLNNESAFTIYPNPAEYGFYIETNNMISNTAQVEITDVNGQKIFAGSMEDQKLFITTENIPAGMYTVKLITEEKTFVKNVIVSDLK
ncbi:MAG: T9SS type A sorting domain-containing protein [Chitinophagales bacterium]|nr:T9SS type A sorting domain-containing protein [Chitinophagales bacterium]